MSETGSVADLSDIEDQMDNGLSIEGTTRGLENLYEYEAGGHHPVHLNDTLHERYRVIHKLGSGHYANVWLCTDITSDKPSYVALKIIMAEDSTRDCPEMRVNKLLEIGLDNKDFTEHFCLPLDQFEINGPNGQHYVLVYPVLGPRVSRLHHVSKLEDPGKILRKICLQTAQAMGALHANGICHGDFRPANILARISGLDGLSKQAVLEALGHPETAKVVTVSGDAHIESTAPQYLVYPISWEDVELSSLGADFISDKACIIDFGESYEVSSPTPDLGIPQIYCSPEYALDHEVAIGSDIWALGCTLFEIRTGRRLFDIFDDDQDDYLIKMAMLLGKLPEPWWSTTWERRKDFFEDDGDADGRVVEIHTEINTKKQFSADGMEIGAVVFQREEPRSLRDAIAEGMFQENSYGPGGIHRDISQEETELFSDLLGGIFKYDPAERVTAHDILKHAWFDL